MRNKIIRMKRLRAQRALDDFMRMPTRIVTGIDYREINAKALADNSLLWAVPETKVGRA